MGTRIEGVIMERSAGSGKCVRSWLGALRASLCAAALASCTSLGLEDVPKYVTEIEAQNRHMEEEFRAGNLLGVADVYADDGVLLDARGQRTAGREDIDAYWSAIEHPVDWRLKSKRIRGSDVIAYETGTSYLTTRREGALYTSVCHFLLLWRRDPAGVWRIEMDAYWPAAEP